VVATSLGAIVAMNENNGPSGDQLEVGTHEWLEDAPRRDLIKYIRELQLQIAKGPRVSHTSSVLKPVILTSALYEIRPGQT
jgi:hypothetical protein